MAITLTDKAAQRMSDYLANRGSGVGVRLSVQTTGCSGLGYNMEFVDSVNDDDTTFDDKGIKVIVDAKSLIYIDGTEVDFQKNPLAHLPINVRVIYFCYSELLHQTNAEQD